jgi:epoxyqueuosine reductase
MELAERIKAEARRLGFLLVGITTPEPPPHLDVYQTWLEAGRHGEMGYLASDQARQRRADPRLILPECKSILCLGIRYYDSRAAGDHPDPAAQNTGRVASYAWGDDYHDVLPERLQALVGFIEEQVEHAVPNRWYTDTGPILERDLAQRAGLGWQGKNTCLINPQHGSYFLLAEILLGLELEPDPPMLTDHCGSCTRCLDACPTGCILPDRTLDASRCISYLTIELKGSIPEDLRPHIGEWAFGCDICQQVCPWNERFSRLTGDAAFSPRPGLPLPDLLRELEHTPASFNLKFKGSPIKRTKLRGYVRNIAVALGNSGNPAAVAALGRALQVEPEPLVRAHAAWALGQIGGSEALQALRSAQFAEIDAHVSQNIRSALVTAARAERPGSKAGTGEYPDYPT